MDGFSISYGLDASAATVKAMIDTGLKYENAVDYSCKIFNLFKISGDNSYEMLIEKIKSEKNCDRIISLLESYLDDDEFDCLFKFLNSFLGLTYEKYKPLFVHEVPIKIKKIQDFKTIPYINIIDEYFVNTKGDFDIANHLTILEEIYDNDKINNNLLFMVDSKETGLIAMSYMSSMLNEFGFFCGYEDDWDGTMEEYNKIIPIIYANELNDKFYNYNEFSNFSDGEGKFLTTKGERNSLPWWDNFYDIPIILIIEDGDFIHKDFIEKLEYLKGNYSNIYIIYVNKKVKSQMDIIFGSMGIDKVIDDISFKLNYSTYKIEDPEIDSKYSVKVFRDYVHKNNYKVDKELDIKEILERLKKKRRYNWEGNKTIKQAIVKAVTIKKDSSAVLKMRDFEYLDFSLANHKESEVEKGKTKSVESVLEKIENNIYGLDDVKRTMIEAVNLLELNKKREKSGLKAIRVNNTFGFYGAPGVGKTEMAQYFGELMFEKDLLPGNKFININGAQLKAQYVGHTAPKVERIFEENDVIFIDEAYSISSDGAVDSFGQEALAELCAQLEKHSKDKLVIFAGYGGKHMSGKNDKMKEFLDINPGIQSRITFNVDFPVYSAHKEMPHIFEKIVFNAEYNLEEGWRDITISYFEQIEKSPKYGNAREARRLFQHCANIQATRIIESNTYEKRDLMLIKNEDIKKAIINILGNESKSEEDTRRKMGFWV